MPEKELEMQSAEFDVMQRGTIIHYVFERLINDYKEDFDKLQIEFLNNDYTEGNPLYFKIDYNGFIYEYKLYSKVIDGDNLWISTELYNKHLDYLGSLHKVEETILPQ